MSMLTRLCVLSVISLSSLVSALRLAQPNPTLARTYLVQANDTLSAIALRFHIDLGELARLNGIANPDQLRAGQVLTVPDGFGGARIQSQQGEDGPRADRGQPSHYVTGSMQGTYVVERGDTLSALSFRFGVPLAELARANGIDSANLLRAGRRLLIPAQQYGGMASVAEVPTATAGASYIPGLAATATATVTSAMVAPTIIVPLTSQTELGALLTSQAVAYGLDPALVKAVAWQESGWSMVVARDGGIGVMQLMPATAAWVGPSLLGRAINPYNLQDNIQAGVALLASYLRQYGDVRLALAAYNEGQKNLARGILSSTAQYISNVLALQARFAQ
jgi:soluble lytic murein transglycosylase-like protein